MRVDQRSDQPIAAAQPFRQQGRIMARDRQTAARRRTIERECSDDGVATGDQGPIHHPQIGVLIGRLGQEMERGPVMPDLEAACGLPVQDVRHHPFDRRIWRKPPPGGAQGGVGEIESRDPAEPLVQQAIHQPRGAGADIDDGRVPAFAPRGAEVQR